MNIIVILTNSHLVTVNQIIEQNQLDNVILIDPYGYQKKVKELTYRIIGANNIIDNNHLSYFKSLNNQRKKIKLAKHILKEFGSKSINLFVPHLGDIVTNALYSSLNIGQLFLYEDGILPYYEHKFSKVDLRKNRIKFVLAGLHGIQYNYRFESFLPYNDLKESLSGIYLRFPEFYNRKCMRVIKIHTKKIQFEKISNKVLIIGQEGIIGSLGRERYFHGLVNLLAKIKEFPISQIVYKPHRFCDEADLEFVYSIFKKDEVIISDSPVEELVSLIRPSNIYSFNSSALLNLRYMLDPNIQIGASYFFNRKMEDLFKRVGIIEL